MAQGIAVEVFVVKFSHLDIFETLPRFQIEFGAVQCSQPLAQLMQRGEGRKTVVIEVREIRRFPQVFEQRDEIFLVAIE